MLTRKTRILVVLLFVLSGTCLALFLGLQSAFRPHLEGAGVAGMERDNPVELPIAQPGSETPSELEGKTPSTERRGADRRPVASARIGDLIPGGLGGRVTLAGSGEPLKGLSFWIEQEELWAASDSMAQVVTDEDGRFRLPAGFRRSTVSVGRAWRESEGADPIYELEPRRLQLHAARELELVAHPPRLTLVVRGRYADGTYAKKPSITLVSDLGDPHLAWSPESILEGGMADRQHKPARLWSQSTEESSVFRLFASDLQELHLRALMRSEAKLVSTPIARSNSSRPSSRAAARKALRFETDNALSLSDLQGEVHHTFALRPRPELSVKLLDAEGEPTSTLGSTLTPRGLQVYGLFPSGDLVPARLDRSAGHWHFDWGWITPGTCEVRVLDGATLETLIATEVELQAGAERTVEFLSSQLRVPLVDAEGSGRASGLLAAGHVTDEEGEGVEGIAIQVVWGSQQTMVYTNSRGSFQVYGRRGTSTKLRLRVAEDASHGRFEPQETQVEAGEMRVSIQRLGTEEVDLRLTLLDARSQSPILGLRHLTLRRSGELDFPEEVAEFIDVDAQARAFTASYSRGVGVEWIARAPHFESRRGLLADPPLGREELELDVSLQPGFREAYRCFDAALNSPLAGVIVREFGGRLVGESDLQGRLEVELAEWPEGLLFEHPSFESYRLRLDWNGLCDHWHGQVNLRRKP